MNAIDDEKVSFRAWLRATYLHHRPCPRGPPSAEWTAALDLAQSRITALNRRIDDFNIRRPASLLNIHRFRLRLSDELTRLPEVTDHHSQPPTLAKGRGSP